MCVLLLIRSFNSLLQRLFVALQAAGHEESIEFDISDGLARDAVVLFGPDVIIAA